ncbi:MAG: glycosyltransferase, partial [Actinobacteria bacterium]|nr:glycosyltransferase [Actinomycetota bacterium]
MTSGLAKGTSYCRTPPPGQGAVAASGGTAGGGGLREIGAVEGQAVAGSQLAHRALPGAGAGGGPEEAELRGRLGDAATFLGWLGGEELAVAYASADAFLFCSVTDTYGQVILEAGASGLPVIAIAEGGPAALVENRHTGLLCRPDADHVAGSILQ